LSKIIGANCLLELAQHYAKLGKTLRIGPKHNLFSTEDSDFGNEWIFSTFGMNAAFNKITDDFQDNLNGMMTSRRFQDFFKEKSRSDFLCEVGKLGHFIANILLQKTIFF
jgi:hypothetical protein